MRVSAHTRAALLAVTVTMLWSTSWVLIKRVHLPPLSFAGLRYFLGFLCLAPFALRAGAIRELRGLSVRDWAELVALGLTMYAIAQGAQFAALSALPANTVALLLNLVAPLTAALGAFLLRERLRPVQWFGLTLCAAGVVVYFWGQIAFPAVQRTGLIASALCVASNVAAALLGRHINRTVRFSALTVTTASMGIGSTLLLLVGVATQGVPHPTATEWLILSWLVVVNTALAFTLWNATLRILSAAESSVIGNLMLGEIAVLARIFLAEPITRNNLAGMALNLIGTLIVQLRRPGPPESRAARPDSSRSTKSGTAPDRGRSS